MFTIFIILTLGLMAALAVFQGLDQFGTLAATAAGYVFVNGYVWTISPPWVGSWFWTVWVIAFVVAVVAHFRKGMIAAAVAATFGVLAIVFAGLVPATIASQTVTAAQATIEVGETDQEGGDETPMAAGAEVQAKAPAGTGGAVEACAPDNVQQWHDAVNNRLVPAGLWSADGKAATTAEIADANQRAAVGADARYLAEMAWYEGLWDSPSNWAELITADKSCLSNQGQALKGQLFAKWDSGKTSLVQDDSGYNTGRTADGQFVQAKVAGITGDITTLLRNYESHSSQTLVRCGNPKLEGPSQPAARPDKTVTPPVSSPKPKPTTPTATPTTTPTATPTTTPTATPTTTPTATPTTTPPTEEPTTPPTEEPTTPPTEEPTTPPTEEPTTPPTEEPCPPWEDDTVPPRNEDGTCPKDPGAGAQPDPNHTGAPGPTEQAETEEPVEESPADPGVTPGAPDPDITVPTSEPSSEPTTPGSSTGPTNVVEPTNEPTSVTPEATEDPNSEEEVITDDNPPPFGGVDGNDLAGAGAAGAMLIPLLRRKRVRQH